MSHRFIGKTLLAALLCALCAVARAQAPATEKQAAAYIHDGFRTDAASDMVAGDVKLGAELARRLNLPPGADGRAIYDTLVHLVDPEKIAVRKASPEELAHYGAQGVELQQPLFALESAGMTLLIQYDLRANNITYIGQLSGPEEPVARNAPPPAAAAPSASAAPEAPAAIIAAPAAAETSGGWRLPLTPYKIEIQQGNYVSQDMVAQLKTGMSKDQVRQIMGTPLLNDVFHAERWDYVFSRVTSDGRRESRRLALFFQDGKLARVDGTAAPAPVPESSAAGR